MLHIGSRAPEFILTDDQEREISLTAMLNAGPLLLYFHPGDFKPGIGRKVRQLAVLQPELRRAGLQLAGVSPQLPAELRQFRARHTLPGLLLADPDRAVLHMYEVRGPFGIGVRRVTCLIDQGRIIQGAVCSNLRIAPHIDFIRQATTQFMRQAA
jgi:peroxiredoxin Q/BCP